MHKEARRLHRVLFAIACLLLASLPASARSPLTLAFHGTDFHHRWSKDGQHEFTPPDQEELARWQDMITLTVKRDIRTADQLAGYANGLLATFEGAGKILATDSKAMTADEPAEHLLVALLPGDAFIEIVFARMTLTEQSGLIRLYAKRIHGPNAAEEGATWINENASEVAHAWTQWDGAPSLSELDALPESE